MRDRVDISSLSSESKMPDADSIQLDNLLPNSEDEEAIRQNYAVLVARTLVKYAPFFSKFQKALERHILHEHSAEMARKSEVVC